MHPILFWTFAIIMILFGILVIANRNPVASALSLVVSFLCLAALFISLDAYFIGVIQVLVYAGAIMVLFLFIIMLLDLKAERLRRPNVMMFSGGIVVVLGFVWLLFTVVTNFEFGKQTAPALKLARFDDVKMVGATLFSLYNLPFQIVAVLILVATIGVVILSKRELK